MSLILSGNDLSINPYIFKTTGIKVFSYEEAMYHCYHYWSESLYDFAENDIVEWIKAELKIELSYKEKISESFLEFLFSSAYFDEEEISALKDKLLAWENRDQFERLKEKADELYLRGSFRRAVKAYKDAIEVASRSEWIIFNNIGLSLLKLEEYNEACDYFEKAYSISNKNETILFNYIEALIFKKDYSRAKEELLKVNEDHRSYYFLGEIEMKQLNLKEAVQYFERSLKLNKDLDVTLKLCDILINQRKYDKVLSILNDLDIDSPEVLIMKSKVYAASGNYGAAIRNTESILIKYPKRYDLWAVIARYHRLAYDLEKAEAAIENAIRENRAGYTKSDSLCVYDENILFEYAKIKKAQGKIKDYQESLREILNSFKKTYREGIL